MATAVRGRRIMRCQVLRYFPGIVSFGDHCGGGGCGGVIITAMVRRRAALVP